MKTQGASDAMQMAHYKLTIIIIIIIIIKVKSLVMMMMMMQQTSALLSISHLLRTFMANTSSVCFNFTTETLINNNYYY